MSDKTTRDTAEATAMGALQAALAITTRESSGRSRADPYRIDAPTPAEARWDRAALVVARAMEIQRAIRATGPAGRPARDPRMHAAAYHWARAFIDCGDVD